MHRLRSDQAVELRSTGQPRAAVPTWSEAAVPILFVIVVLAGLSVALCAQAGDPTAPTAAQDPATIDRTWQKASAKYDAARTAILKDVDRVNAGGRFRADWESLQSYKVPDWYWDANSGIFFTSPVRSMRAMAKLKFRISRTHTLGEP